MFFFFAMISQEQHCTFILCASHEMSPGLSPMSEAFFLFAQVHGPGIARADFDAVPQVEADMDLPKTSNNQDSLILVDVYWHYPLVN